MSKRVDKLVEKVAELEAARQYDKRDEWRRQGEAQRHVVRSLVKQLRPLYVKLELDQKPLDDFLEEYEV